MLRRAEQRRAGIVVEQRQPGPPGEQHRHGRQQADADRDAELVRPALGRAEFAARPVEGTHAQRHLAAARKEALERRCGCAGDGHDDRVIHSNSVGSRFALAGPVRTPAACSAGRLLVSAPRPVRRAGASCRRSRARPRRSGVDVEQRRRQLGRRPLHLLDAPLRRQGIGPGLVLRGELLLQLLDLLARLLRLLPGGLARAIDLLQAGPASARMRRACQRWQTAKVTADRPTPTSAVTA